jgi:DNA-binding transcriptional LysR family regulator
MDWTGLQDFIAVAETGSLSAAARQRGLSQPTIGRRIEHLERDLKALLFNRTPKGLTLTGTGERILAHARRMSEEALAVERLASGADQRIDGSVRVTLTDLMGTRWLPGLLPEFQRRYPGLRLEVAVDNRTLDLVRREADIAVRFARPQQLDLVARRVIRYGYGLYASGPYLERRGEPRALRDLQGHDFVGYDEAVIRHPGLRRIERLFGEGRIVHRATGNAGVLAAIAAGIGIGISACYFSDSEPGLVRLMPQRFNFDFEGWVVTHEDLFGSARIRAVFDFLVGQLEREAGRFAGAGGNRPPD